MIEIEIRRYLKESGSKPYLATSNTCRIKKHHEEFSTLAELKSFYGITKVVKSGMGWAISRRGKKVEWNEYTAEISDTFKKES